MTLCSLCASEEGLVVLRMVDGVKIVASGCWKELVVLRRVGEELVVLRMLGRDCEP